jgi:hypothetical protein
MPIWRTILLGVTAFCLLFLATYSFFAPELAGSPYVIAAAVVACFGVGLVWKFR